MATLFQAGVIVGLIQGVYQGDVSFKTLAQHGNLGLGTVNDVNGEMIAVDGQFYCADETGQLTLINPATLTPFAAVAPEETAFTFHATKMDSLDALNQWLDTQLPTLNIFYMLRIEATLTHITLRSESCHLPLYTPLPSILPKVQKTFERTQIKGTLVGTRSPEYGAGINVCGYHYHFVDADRKIGGHVFNAAIASATIKVTPIRQINLNLFDTEVFDRASLNIDMNSTKAALSKTE